MLCHRDCEYSASLDNAKLFSKLVTPFYAPASVMETLMLLILIILGIVFVLFAHLVGDRCIFSKCPAR